MFSSVGRSFDDLDRITELSNKIASSLQNYIAARTAIRDYVISTDDKFYAQVELRLTQSIEALALAEIAADEGEASDTIRHIHHSIRTWGNIARQVRDSFSNYRQSVQEKVLASFSALSHTSTALMQSGIPLMNEIVMDVQTTHAAIAGYLINGDDSLANNAEEAIAATKAKIAVAQQSRTNTDATLQALSATFDTYAAGFRESVVNRKSAYRLFQENLAPLGSATQETAERFHRQTVERQRKVEELKKAYRALEEVSFTDPLTGIWNRRFLNQHIDADAALALRHYESWQKTPGATLPTGIDLVFIMVDIDHFKAVNDQYGHAVGDQLIVQIKDRLKEVFRESDYLIRWGGEEFLAVARGVNRADAEIIAERVCAAVRDREFEMEGGVRLKKTCSVGFACFPFLPNHPRLLSWAQTVELADQALYIAKHGGRDAWAGLLCTERTRPEEVLRRLAQATAQAVEDGELLLKTSLKETVQTISSIRQNGGTD